MSNDKKFYKEIKFIFESYLSPSKDVLCLRVRNVENNSILSDADMNYSKVFFDSNLNVYKKGKDGNLIKIEDDNFEAVVMRQE